MVENQVCLSDAARRVVDGTLARLKSVLTQQQFNAITELSKEGRLFDVKALVALADSAPASHEAINGN